MKFENQLKFGELSIGTYFEEEYRYPIGRQKRNRYLKIAPCTDSKGRPCNCVYVKNREERGLLTYFADEDVVFWGQE